MYDKMVFLHLSFEMKSVLWEEELCVCVGRVLCVSLS